MEPEIPHKGPGCSFVFHTIKVDLYHAIVYMASLVWTFRMERVRRKARKKVDFSLEKLDVSEVNWSVLCILIGQFLIGAIQSYTCSGATSNVFVQSRGATFSREDWLSEEVLEMFKTSKENQHRIILRHFENGRLPARNTPLSQSDVK